MNSFKINIIIATFVIFLSSFAFAQDQNTNIAIVNCGWSQPCSIADLITSSDRLSQAIIKIIFPALFFVGGFISILPLIKDPSNPSNRADSKHRFKILLIGSSLILGAYVIIVSVLSFMGANTDTIKETISLYNKVEIYEESRINFNFPNLSVYSITSDLMFDKAYAIKNPIENKSVQELLLTVANGIMFLAMIAGAYAMIRGGLLLVWAYQSPNESSVEVRSKAKWWIIAGLIIWVFFFGAEYFIKVIYNTLTDFSNVAGK